MKSKSFKVKTYLKYLRPLGRRLEEEGGGCSRMQKELGGGFSSRSDCPMVPWSWGPRYTGGVWLSQLSLLSLAAVRSGRTLLLLVSRWLDSYCVKKVHLVLILIPDNSRLLKHPHREFYQCTSEFKIELMSEFKLIDDKPYFDFYGFDPKTIYGMYNFWFLFFVYFLPLVCIIISYVAIFFTIIRSVAHHFDLFN